MTQIRKWEHGTSGWPLVIAFILGIVLTAMVAQAVTKGIERHNRASVPGLERPGSLPGTLSGEPEINRLVYASYGKALIA